MKVSYNLRIEDSTKKELENLAKKLNRSLNNLLNVIIEEYAEKYRYKPYKGYNELPTKLHNYGDGIKDEYDPKTGKITKYTIGTIKLDDLSWGSDICKETE